MNRIKINSENIPFYIALLSTFITVITAIFIFKPIIYIPELITISSYIIWLFSSKQRGKYKWGFLRNFFIIIVSFFVIVSYLFTDGFGSLGTLSLVVVSIIFAEFLINSSNQNLQNSLKNSFFIIYGIHIVFILFENIINFSGLTNFLTYFLGDASLSELDSGILFYKTYNHAFIFDKLGFQIPGANSLLLGSQSASQISLFAIIIFWPSSFISKRFSLKFNIKTLLFLGSLFAYALTISNTSVMIFLGIVFLIILLKNKIKYLGFLLIPTLLLFFAFRDFILKIFFYRISSIDDFLLYFYTYVSSLIRFNELPLFNKLFGAGRNSIYLDNLFADFGFGMLLIQMGIILMIFLVFTMMILFFDGLKTFKFYILKYSYLNKSLKGWLNLGIINLLCTFGWFFSLIHYTIAVEGGRILFAFHLASFVISLKKIKNINFKNNKLLYP